MIDLFVMNSVAEPHVGAPRRRGGVGPVAQPRMPLQVMKEGISILGRLLLQGGGRSDCFALAPTTLCTVS